MLNLIKGGISNVKETYKIQVAENVIVINDKDEMTGTMDKLAAHLKGKLHRAFSVFIFNSSGELLLQQRALHKYHSGGVWTNTCCSHPRLGEDTHDAANRRLKEEMGMTSQLQYQFNFTYRAEFDNGLIEHEYDHVFFGKSNQLPLLNASEVADYKYINMNDLAVQLKACPDSYSAWLNLSFGKVMDHYTRYFN